MNAAAMPAGLPDPVHDSQRAFRAVLEALARPATVQRLGNTIAGLPLQAALSHLLLTLCDEETPVWWQHDDASLGRWLRFHTGARPAAAAAATLAVVTRPERMPALAGFAQGTNAAPERSATLLVEVPSLGGGPAMQAWGPGIAQRRSIRVAGLPADFWPQWQANHARFPCGVDVVFTCGDTAMGLPRTTRVGLLEGV